MTTLKPWTIANRHVEFSGGPIREIVKETVLLPDGRVISWLFLQLRGAGERELLEETGYRGSRLTSLLAELSGTKSRSSLGI